MRRELVGLSVAVACLWVAPAASAATFAVTDTSDAPLALGTGTACVSTNAGSCTLRAAIQAADNLGGASSISVPAGTFRLSIAPATRAGTTILLTGISTSTS